MHFASPPFPSPTAPLPALPLQAPPPTPRNCSHLYGEFSWPSLDIATLLDKLEDVAEEEQQQDPLADFAEMLVARYAEQDNSIPTQQAAFGEILQLLEGTALKKEKRISEWLEGVYEEVDDEYDDSLYFTASESGDSESRYFGCED
ncbi:MAG: hypothetical protein Q9178_005464 [Gyalolechia marmorata]